MTIQVSSSAFTEGAPIPAKHTCESLDVSPPLKWSNIPPNAKSIALIADDPDAPVGTWVHWILYNLPPTVTELPEGVPTTYLSAILKPGLRIIAAQVSCAPYRLARRTDGPATGNDFGTD